MNSILKASDGSENIPEIQIRLYAEPNLKFIFVEGENDKLFFNKFKSPDVNVYPAPTKGGWMEVCRFVQGVNNPRVIGIRDSDFTEIFNEPRPDRIFRTDYHDAEMYFIASDVTWKKLYNELLPDDEKNVFSKRESIFRALQKISYSKLLNYHEKLGLNFDSVHITDKKFFSAISLAISFPEYLTELNNNSNKRQRDLTLEEIEKGFAENGYYSKILSNIPLSDLPYIIHNGHDYFFIFQALIQNQTHKGYNDNNLHTFARLAYPEDEFKDTKLYQNITVYSQEQGLEFFK